MDAQKELTRPSVSFAGHSARTSVPCCVIAALVVTLLTTPWAFAAQATAEDGPAYQVDQLYIDFAEDLPVHPPVKLMMKLDVELGETPTGYVSPRDGMQTVKIRLMDVPRLKNKSMHASAIQQIGNVIVEHFRDWGYAGVTAVPHPQDIDATGKDVRLEGQTALRIIVNSMTGRGRPVRIGAIWEGPDARDGQVYKVGQFIIEKAGDVEAAIDTKALLKTNVVLAEDEQGMFSPRAGTKQIQVRLLDVPRLGNKMFYTSALHDISEALTKAVGIDGLYVWASAKDIDESGQDVRFQNQSALRMTIQHGTLPERPEFVEVVQVDQGTGTGTAEEVIPVDLPQANERDGKRYPVNQIIVEYAEDHPGLPPLGEVMDTTVLLTEVEGGYVAPRSDADVQEVKIAELPTLRQSGLYGSAIRHINTELVGTFNDKGYIGIYIAPHPDDISSEGEDIRPETQTAMRVLVRTGVVTQVRTIAAGNRIAMEDRVNNPKHERLKENAPISENEPSNLLRKDKLDEYVYWLNRHPGRRVDVAVAPGEDPGSIALDMLVTENKPWLVFAQVSNTGTEQTREWRERFGFIHNQLTNNDDILSIDYITAGFQDAHTVIGSYEAPFFDVDRLRFKVEGLYSEFTASDVGAANQDFDGNSWSAGGELIWNVWQQNEMFLDLVAGATWQHVEVNDNLLQQFGNEDFFLPHVGAKFERVTNKSTLLGSVDYEINVSDVADTQESELTKLGRLDTDEDAMRLVWDLYYSFYLEPLLWPNKWEDNSTWKTSTLAHEILIHARGQYAFDTRLNPQRQRTAGGLFSVRGYDESLVAADTVAIITGEYRFHLPRVLAPKQDPGTLFGRTHKWRPQYVYGRPDWDLILRTFVDFAGTTNSQATETFEEDEILLSAGIGAEFLLRRNFSVRVDWGFVLDEVEARGNGQDQEIGDSRVHVLATLLY